MPRLERESVCVLYLTPERPIAASPALAALAMTNPVSKKTKANPYYVLFEENSQGYLVKSKTAAFKTRQECPVIYEVNGAVYVIDTNCLLNRPITSFERIKKYVMDEFSSLDIDTMLDWKFAEFLFAENK